MQGETDLNILLRDMQPRSEDKPYVFVSLDEEEWQRVAPFAFSMVRELEGISVILEAPHAERSGFSTDELWDRITLWVPSALTAVGFLAVITAKLAAAGISVNPVAGVFHDHLFVPWEKREEALLLITELSV